VSYDNNNRGAIWRNDRKEKDTHPDFKGELNVNGVSYWVSAWERKPDAKSTAPALSFSVKEKESNQSVNQAQQGMQPDFDDGIPF
jgi:hypothetical protein